MVCLTIVVLVFVHLVSRGFLKQIYGTITYNFFHAFAAQYSVLFPFLRLNQDKILRSKFRLRPKI